MIKYCQGKYIPYLYGPVHNASSLPPFRPVFFITLRSTRSPTLCLKTLTPLSFLLAYSFFAFLVLSQH